jgi:hypothetical protein
MEELNAIYTLLSVFFIGFCFSCILINKANDVTFIRMVISFFFFSLGFVFLDVFLSKPVWYLVIDSIFAIVSGIVLGFITANKE